MLQVDAMNPAEIISRLRGAGMPEVQAITKGKLFESVFNRLAARGIDTGRANECFFVPGRIEFLGKHTDYAGGRSLVCAIDRGFCLAAFPRADSLICVWGETAEADSFFPLESGLIPAQGNWANYPMTVGRRLAINFPGRLRGADISFTSDLPASSGLSSSSALMISFFMAIDSVNRLEERPEYRANVQNQMDLAGYLSTIENGLSFGTLGGDRGVGTRGGSEDHAAIMLGVPGHLSQFAFCPLRLERQIQLPVDYTLVICASGVVAVKTGNAQVSYNSAVSSASAILARWRSVSGRVDLSLAEAVAAVGDVAIRATLHQRELIDRFDQFVAESIQIVPAAGDALISHRLSELGSIVRRSQESAERLLKNQVPETVFLAKSARQCGAIAASTFGAGFGGSVWALIASNDTDAFITQWKGAYQQQFPMAFTNATFFAATAGAAAIKL